MSRVLTSREFRVIVSRHLGPFFRWRQLFSDALQAARLLSTFSSTSYASNSCSHLYSRFENDSELEKQQRMADGVLLFDPTQAHAADTEFFVRRGMTKGYQLLSLLAPPAYAAFAISRYGRSHLNMNRLLRATWVGSSVGESMCNMHQIWTDSHILVGVIGGGAVEYARASWSDNEKLRQRRLVAVYDVSTLQATHRRTSLKCLCQTSSLRADDHATIGGVLFAVVTPALFWKRANAINRAYKMDYHSVSS